MVGRPRLLNAESKAMIITAIEAGSSIRMAAKFVRCDPKTIREECKRDPEFSLTLKQAEAKCYLLHLAGVREGKPGWQAHAWFLERKHHDEFGLKTPSQNVQPPAMPPPSQYVPIKNRIHPA